MRATVVGLTDQGGIVLDRTVFYATSGGQPGDRGVLVGRRRRDPVLIERCILRRSRENRDRARAGDGSGAGLAIGEPVNVLIDWELRYARMRMHTALHLLSAVLPYPVTGGAVGDAEAGSTSTFPKPASTRTRSPASSPR